MIVVKESAVPGLLSIDHITSIHTFSMVYIEGRESRVRSKGISVLRVGLVRTWTEHLETEAVYSYTRSATQVVGVNRRKS